MFVSFWEKCYGCVITALSFISNLAVSVSFEVASWMVWLSRTIHPFQFMPQLLIAAQTKSGSFQEPLSNLKWTKSELTSDCSSHTKGTSANATTRRMVNSWSTWTSVFWHTYTRARVKKKKDKEKDRQLVKKKGSLLPKIPEKSKFNSHVQEYG